MKTKTLKEKNDEKRVISVNTAAPSRDSKYTYEGAMFVMREAERIVWFANKLIKEKRELIYATCIYCDDAIPEKYSKPLIKFFKKQIDRCWCWNVRIDYLTKARQISIRTYIEFGDMANGRSMADALNYVIKEFMKDKLGLDYNPVEVDGRVFHCDASTEDYYTYGVANYADNPNHDYALSRHTNWAIEKPVK